MHNNNQKRFLSVNSLSANVFSISRDCLSFYGYLKRLELWHNARINFFDIEELVLKSGGTKNRYKCFH